jgi:hypothetical protein
MSMIPSITLIACPSILSNKNIAMVEKMTKAAAIGSMRFHVTYFKYLIMTTVADVNESSPESVTASP